MFGGPQDGQIIRLPDANCTRFRFPVTVESAVFMIGPQEDGLTSHLSVDNYQQHIVYGNWSRNDQGLRVFRYVGRY